jgi:saccharopine dehydrogenase-like NADP-dependent oxidoreductase
VPPVAAAMLIADGTWDPGTMVNVEELDPRPFLAILNRIGLPTRIKEGDRDEAFTYEG